MNESIQFTISNYIANEYFNRESSRWSEYGVPSAKRQAVPAYVPYYRGEKNVFGKLICTGQSFSGITRIALGSRNAKLSANSLSQRLSGDLCGKLREYFSVSLTESVIAIFKSVLSGLVRGGLTDYQITFIIVSSRPLIRNGSANSLRVVEVFGLSDISA